MADPSASSTHEPDPNPLTVARALVLGDPFLSTRVDQGEIAFSLGSDRRAVIGRERGCDVPLPWDASVSRVHAEIEAIGRSRVIFDDGLSRNGTYINNRRLVGRARLHHGDVVRLGGTSLTFHDPWAAPDASTILEASSSNVVAISPAQRRLLVALARPYLLGAAYPRPSTNQEIADELVVEVSTVKSTLKQLYRLFEVDVPDSQKRASLVERAISLGVVTHQDAK